ncbi:MAG: acyltransferase [Acidobacteriota bacterium]|jgi:acetyltransferase-like isoleucine patch superfamily enzyme
MSRFIHPNALVEGGASLGDRTRIWAFAHVLPGARIGSDCNICDNVFIENDVIVGDRVTVKCGVQLWDGLRIEDDAFIGPNATFTNDMRPRSKQYPQEFPKTQIGKGATIGANATILPGRRIGAWAMVGAGSVVTRDVPDFALVTGNPGRLCGWVCRCGQKLGSFAAGAVSCPCGRSYQIISDQTIEEKVDVP